MKLLFPPFAPAACALLVLASSCASVTETSRPSLGGTASTRPSSVARPAGTPVGAYLVETLDAPAAEAASATLDAGALSTQEAAKVRLAERKLVAADFRARLAQANELLKANPRNARALFERAKANSNLKNYRLARLDYLAALRTMRGNPDLYYNKGVNELMLNQFKLAANDFSGTVRLRPDDKEAFFGRGVAKMQMYQYKAAVSDFSRALALDSTYADALEYRGISYANVDRAKEAQRDLEKAARLNPEAKKNLRRYGSLAQQ